MPPNVIVCRHCKKPVLPADIRWRRRLGGYDFEAWGKTHAIAELFEGGPLDSNRKRTVIKRRVLVCLVGLNRWH
jgi:hypothetical protein